tara:strand:+ start:89 stop:670 length:582 start_codon:yes stop_codon:yes gene_type:complete
MPFSGTLPRAAIVSDMAIFEHPTWAHRTVESDGLRSPGGSAWPTPTVSEAERGHGYQRSGDRLYPTLTGAVGATNHWPTPLATDTEELSGSLSRIVKTGNPFSRNDRRTFATPTARDWRSGKTSQATAERNSRPLSEQIEMSAKTGRLSPRFVEALMGFPDNWTAIDGPPHLDHSTHGSRRGPDPDSDTIGND